MLYHIRTSDLANCETISSNRDTKKPFTTSCGLRSNFNIEVKAWFYFEVVDLALTIFSG